MDSTVDNQQKHENYRVQMGRLKAAFPSSFHTIQMNKSNLVETIFIFALFVVSAKSANKAHSLVCFTPII